MRAKKVVRILGTLLGTLILILACVVLFWLGPTIKVIAQQVGSKALGAPLTIERLIIRPFKGTVDLSGFAIANQPDFVQSNAVSLVNLGVAIDIGSIFTETVTVHQVQLDGLELTYEQSSATDNFTEFMKKVQEFARIDPEAPAKEKDEDKVPKLVIVESLELNDLTFHLDNTEKPLLDIQVGMEQMAVSMTNGTVSLRNLEITNPGRLATSNLFTLASIDIQLDPQSIYSDMVSIQDIQIKQPYVWLEQNTETGTIGELQKLAESFIKETTTKPPAKTPNSGVQAFEKEAASAAPPVELHNLVVDDIQLKVLDATREHNNAFTLASIESINAKLVDGIVSLNKLQIGSPDRLATPNLFSLAGIDIQLDPDSLYSGTVSLQDIRVKEPYLYLEKNALTDTVSEFLSLAEAFTPEQHASATPSANVPPKAPSSAAPPPFELHSLVVDDIQLQLLDSTRTNVTTASLEKLASIGSVSVRLVEGRIEIDSITIPNTGADFTSTNLFQLAKIEIGLDPASVFSDQVVIQKIFIDTPAINLEQTETTGNVTELHKIAEGFIPPVPEQPEDAPPQKPATETAPPVPLAEQPVVLDLLQVTNLAINMVIPAPDPENKDTAPLNFLSFDLLSVTPLKGMLQIDNLQVGNPHGFANKNLVKLDQFRVDIDPDSMQSDTMLIEDILIEKPRIAYERKLSTDNIKALQEFIKGVVEKRLDAKEEIALAQEAENNEMDNAPEEPGQKVIIEHLLVQNGLVKAKLSALPSAPVPLPDIEMNDIGKESDGTSFKAAFSTIGSTLYDSIIGSVAGLAGFAGDALKGVGAMTLGNLGVPGMGSDNEDKEVPATQKDEAAEPAVIPAELPPETKPVIIEEAVKETIVTPEPAPVAEPAPAPAPEITAEPKTEVPTVKEKKKKTRRPGRTF